MSNPITNDPIIQQRFWNKVDKSNPDGCWNWTGGKNDRGYGLAWINGKSKACHRTVWEFKNGPIPDDLCVLHICDNPGCVNPTHLFLGTHQDNMNDKKNKGRCSSCKGTANGRAKLTEHNIPIIRMLCANGIPQKEVARDYGVSDVAISHIIAGKSWTHIA